MAPFIPEGLVNPQLNLFFALVLGIGFGYILEQAGFSSSRKLAGVFYGYDFVVLRVFFTAGITAMTGMIFLSYMGWIDMSLVFINPTFLWSAILGGVIMGFGFILGGYCPGTSIVAAAVGKVDAMLFLLGAMIGIAVFGHFYNDWESIYTGHFLGNPFVYESLGMPRAWFAFMLVVVAVTAFYITQKIEDNVNQVEAHVKLNRPVVTLPATLVMILALVFLFLPYERRSNANELAVNELHENWLEQNHYVSAQTVLYNIIEENNNIVLIDVREEGDFYRFSLPGAMYLNTSEMFDRPWSAFWDDTSIRKIFYSDGMSRAETAWLAAKRANIENIFVLEGGLNTLFFTLYEEEFNIPDGAPMQMDFNNRFIAKARNYFSEGKGVRQQPTTPIPVTKIIEIETPGGRGGC